MTALRATAVAMLLCLPAALPALGQAPTREAVSVLLQRADGAPAGAGLRVCLRADRPDGAMTEAVSDEDGRAACGPLPCGRYDLWVAPPTGGDLAAALRHGLAVEPGAGEQTLPVSLPEAGAVRGALGAEGAGCVVAVQTATQGAETLAGRAIGALSCYAETTAGDDGSFTLEGLAPGKVALDIRKPGSVHAWSTVEGVAVTAGETTDVGAVALPASGWVSWFDGATLAGWRQAGLFGEQPAVIEDGALLVPTGKDMSGIVREGDVPRTGYEVSLQARRVAGGDFFCGLTFPIGESYASLILGGWGGQVVGVSSLEGMDASQNETSQTIRFEEQRWYRVRVRVTESRLTCWLDGKQIIDLAADKRRFSTRWEMDRCKPLGFATWRTTGALRDIRVRELAAE